MKYADATVLFMFIGGLSSAIPCRLNVDPHEGLNDFFAVPDWISANLLLW